MKKKDLIKSLNFIRNKGFCHYTVHRAIKEFQKIKPYLKEADRKELSEDLMWLNPEYPDYNRAPFTCERFAYHIDKIIQHIEEGDWHGNENCKQHY